MPHERQTDRWRGGRRRAGGQFDRYQIPWVIASLTVMAGLIGILLWLLPEIFDELADPNTQAFLPENTLPIMLIAGTAALLVGLGALVLVLAQLGLTSWKYPLGLPEGSVRAVIALLLIVLFFITAVFLYVDAGRGPIRELRGIDAQRLSAIPTELIQDLRPADADGDRFDVVLVGARSSASTDIAKQLITTVSTLVVAVAAFYFGSSSVQTAQGSRGTGEQSGGGGNGDGDHPGSGTDAGGAGGTDDATAVGGALGEPEIVDDAGPVTGVVDEVAAVEVAAPAAPAVPARPPGPRRRSRNTP